MREEGNFVYRVLVPGPLNFFIRDAQIWFMLADLGLSESAAISEISRGFREGEGGQDKPKVRGKGEKT